MWSYIQSTGDVFDQDGAWIGTGYSGFEQGKNNPEMQEVHETGPIPVGIYEILEPEDSATHGPFAMPLEPSDDNEMFGRSAFLIHGDSKEHPGIASHGCIILARPVREQIWDSGDHQLAVISGEGVETSVT